MKEKESPKILREEIKSLEQILAEKKKELGEAGKEAKHEETVKEAIKEYADAPSDSSDIEKGADDDSTKTAADLLANESHAKQVEELLNIASRKGILNAIKVARHLKNPHLLDDFHDRLVLEFLKKGK